MELLICNPFKRTPTPFFNDINRRILLNFVWIGTSPSIGCEPSLLFPFLSPPSQQHLSPSCLVLLWNPKTTYPLSLPHSQPHMCSFSIAISFLHSLLLQSTTFSLIHRPPPFWNLFEGFNPQGSPYKSSKFSLIFPFIFPFNFTRFPTFFY